MKKFLLGFVAATLVLTLAVGALAASGKLSIEVNTDMQIRVNGELFQPRDVNGDPVMVFEYNGTTYAPLRALAEAYGLVVGYDAENRMATVDAPTTEPGTEPGTEPSTEVKINLPELPGRCTSISVYRADTDSPFEYYNIVEVTEITYEESWSGCEFTVTAHPTAFTDNGIVKNPSDQGCFVGIGLYDKDGNRVWAGDGYDHYAKLGEEVTLTINTYESIAPGEYDLRLLDYKYVPGVRDGSGYVEQN